MLNSTGQLVSHFGGPEWTPYAEAIAAHYGVAVPFYLNVPTTLTGAVNERRTVMTEPSQFDRLIFAAHVQACADGDEAGEDIVTEGGDDVITEDGDEVITEAGASPASNCGGQQVYLQVADDQTGLKWATVAPIDAAPMSAYAGSSENVMPLLKLPEVFFLPAGVRLRHDFKVLAETMTGGVITWTGVQLTEPVNGKAPDFVVMPNGESIKVGSRIPWLAVVGLGREAQLASNQQFQLNSGRRYLAYTQNVDCDVEIIDIHAQFFLYVEELAGNPDLIQFALSDNGERQLWSQSFTPSRAFAGDTMKVFPALPLSKPYLLKKGHQLELTILNNGSGVGVVNGFVVIRGVKRCSL